MTRRVFVGLFKCEALVFAELWSVLSLLEPFATTNAGREKENVPAGRPASKVGTSAPKGKARAGTPARSVAASHGSGMKSARRGTTVASKPCTLVVQPSNKKPTQVGRCFLQNSPVSHSLLA